MEIKKSKRDCVENTDNYIKSTIFLDAKKNIFVVIIIILSFFFLRLNIQDNYLCEMRIYGKHSSSQ